MPVKVIHPDHFELVGEGYVLLIAPHPSNWAAGLHTGQIVEDAALTSRSYAIVGKDSNDCLDHDKAETAQSQLRKSIEAVIEDNHLRCIVVVRGKESPGVDITTSNGETASELITDIVRAKLSKEFSVNVNPDRVPPDAIITSYSRKDANGGFLLEALGLELGESERLHERDRLVTCIAELVPVINQHFGFKEGS